MQNALLMDVLQCLVMFRWRTASSSTSFNSKHHAEKALNAQLPLVVSKTKTPKQNWSLFSDKGEFQCAATFIEAASVDNQSAGAWRTCTK